MPDATSVPNILLPYITPIALLLVSNLFMTIAWYGHLKTKDTPLLWVILTSWAIAFVEYCFAVPANRIGYGIYSAAQLKTIQEIITLVIFAGFSAFVLKETLTWRHFVGFSLIVLGAWFIFQGKDSAPSVSTPSSSATIHSPSELD